MNGSAAHLRGGAGVVKKRNTACSSSSGSGKGRIGVTRIPGLVGAQSHGFRES